MTRSILYIPILCIFSIKNFCQEKNLINNQLKNGVTQISVSGRITDATTGEPLPGSNVLFPDLKLGTSADNLGKFLFANVPAGHYLIEVSHVGYASIIEHIDIDKSTEKDFALQPSVLENQGVIVTGVSNATNIRKAPTPIITLRRAELLQSSSTNIIDLLTKKPGISQLSTGPGISKPIIRGLGYNRVLVVNEGARQEGQQWGDEHGIEIDELSVNRVEILKGPASLMYGSDAMAGVINLITNIPVPEGSIRGNLLANYQTNNDLFALNANLAGNINGVNWNMYGTTRSAGNYENRYDGKVPGSSFNEKNYGGYIGINKKWGFSHLVFASVDQDLGLVEGERDDATGRFILYAGSSLERIATNEDLNERNPLNPRQNIKHYKIISDNSIGIGKSRLKINAGFQKNQRKEFANPEDKNQANLFFDMNTLTYNAQYGFPEVKEWHVTIGANGMYQQSRNRAEEVLIPEYDLFDMGAFIYVQRYFKKFTLSGGARYDNRSVDAKELYEGPDLKFEAFDKSFSNISGSIGFSYEPADFLTLKANVARGFRAPNIAELGSNGEHEGTFRYEYGNKNLGSETSLQFDGGVGINYEHFNLGITGFYNSINKFIFYRKLESVFGGDSMITVDGNDIRAFQFNQLDAKLSGLEVVLDIHPHPLDWLHFENSVSFVRGLFADKVGGTDHLPLMPAPKFSSELLASFKKTGKALRNSYFKVGMETNFRQDKPFFAYNTETATPAYTLLNAGTGTDIINKKEKTIFSVHLAAINLTDAAYQNHLSRLKYAGENLVTGRMGVFNPGRNFSLKINIPIIFKERKAEQNNTLQ
ncbi:MAG TPA: TonB-dependent receptor [Chitinophagaceae bacterium]|nr:TonB-dependent receptor [Chitinophagaceae bacterium]